MLPQYTPNDAARFWAKVDKTSSPHGCWLWLGRPDAYGYGRFWWAGGQAAAHRFSWFLHHGQIPTKREACHNCPGGDNPLCVNPAHLFLGTHAENLADMARKGRSASGSRNGAVRLRHKMRRGEHHGMARLTQEQVEAIRAAYVPRKVSTYTLAARYGVAPDTIGKIVRGETWGTTST